MAAMQESPQHDVDSAKDYADLCVRAAQSFLQTIVVVDDRATYSLAEEVTSLVPPDSGSLEALTEEAGDVDAGSGDFLDVGVLTDASADIGLTCAVLRPRRRQQQDRTLDARLVKAAQRADVLVLDWQLNDETDGQAALRLLLDVVKDDQKGQARLRLVCIYTSHPNLNGVLEATREALAERVLACSDSTHPERWIDCGYLRVVIYAKAGGLGELRAASSQFVEVSELPSKLAEEFSRLTSGLISNVAVASLAAVRRDAHRLLTRFQARLDPAFLSHRYYEGGAESEEMIVRLVADEIKTVLDGADVRRWAEATPVRFWAEQHVAEEITIRPSKVTRVIAKADFVEALAGDSHYGRARLANRAKPGGDFDLEKRISITDLLVGDAEIAAELDYDFACLTSLSRNDPTPFPGTRTPVLSEGTILKGRNGRERVYLLCAMPLCDSVRVFDARAFPFVPLSVVSPNQRYNLVAMSPENERLYLAFSPKDHYEVVRHTFRGDDGGLVRARRRSVLGRDQFVFSDVDSKPWLWVAELRFQHAHRKLHSLGFEASRVGLDESHFLRKASSK